MKNKKIFSVIGLSLVTLLNGANVVQANDGINYVALSDSILINQEVETTNLDLTKFPHYAYGSLTEDDIIANMEEKFGGTATLNEEENRAPYYSFAESDSVFQVTSFESIGSKSEGIFFDTYINLINPYHSLTNFYISFGHNNFDIVPIADETLDFMTKDEAEQTVKDFAQEIFNINELEVNMRSINAKEMQDFVDYQNLNKLKGENYVDDVNEAYFGKITPTLNGIPVLKADIGNPDGNSYVYGVGSEFVLTENGFEILYLFSWVPVGEESGYYSEPVGYESIVKTADKTLSQLYSELQFEDPIFIQNIEVIYAPLNFVELNKSGYFPIWQVSWSNEENTEFPSYLFINPIDGQVIQ